MDERGLDGIAIGDVRHADTGEVVGHTLCERRGAVVTMQFVWNEERDA